jgi:hypothetical protein
MHKDKLRTPFPTDDYRQNHHNIFGPPTGNGKQTKAELEKSAKSRAQSHAQQVKDGKKDAQYYVDHEVRISSDPNYQPPPLPNDAFRENFDRIFGKGD